jgi:hypothetical protein
MALGEGFEFEVRVMEMKGGMDFVEERLTGWVSASQAIEGDLGCGQIEFTADEAAAPSELWAEGLTQQGELCVVIGAADEDGSGFEEVAGSQGCWGRERAALRSGFLTGGGFVEVSVEVLVGMLDQGGDGSMLVASPDLFLPESIEAFDLVLEAVLAWGSEDGDDSEAEAFKDDGAEVTGMVVGSMESEVIVKLGVVRQSVSLPMATEAAADMGGGNGGVGPSAWQSAVEGDGSKDLDIGSTADDKVFNDIEGIEFAVSVGHLGQVPAWRWGGASDTCVASNQAVVGDNASDSSLRRHGGWYGFLGQEAALNGSGADLAKDAVFKFSAEGEDLCDEGCGSSVGGVVRTCRLVLKVDPIEALAASAADPVLDGVKGEMVLTGDPTERLTAASGPNHLATQLRRDFFMRRSIAKRRSPGCAAAPLGSLRSPALRGGTARRVHDKPSFTLATDQVMLSLN